MTDVLLSPDGGILAESVAYARGFRQRAVGLLGRRGLPPGHALYLAPCSAVHTFFMSFTIDLLFVDRDMCLVRLLRQVPPWRFAFGGAGAYGVFETSAGWLPPDVARPGDRLVLRPASSLVAQGPA